MTSKSGAILLSGIGGGWRGALIGKKLIVGGGPDVKLHSGSFSLSAVIELSSELVLLIARVGALLGWLDALSLMMMHNGWNSQTECVCVLRENSTESIVYRSNIVRALSRKGLKEH